MTTPAEPQQPSLQVFDPGHPMGAMDAPFWWSMDLVTGPAGQRLAVTLRLPNTTVTVIMAKDEATNLREQLSAKLAEMTGLIVPTQFGG